MLLKYYEPGFTSWGLYHAVLNNHSDLLEFFDKNKWKFVPTLPLMAACSTNNHMAIDYIMKTRILNTESEWNFLFQYACQNNHVQYAEKAIANNYIPQKWDFANACEHGSLEVSLKCPIPNNEIEKNKAMTLAFHN